MNRRQFGKSAAYVFGGVYVGFANRLVADDEAPDYSCKTGTPSVVPVLNLTPLCDITFEIAWDVQYMGASSQPFNEYQKAKLYAASSLRAQIWGSKQFMDAVTTFKFYDCPDTPGQIYENLTSVKKKHVQYSLSQFSGESAATNNGVTRIPATYFCGKSGTVANLLNTLSHEYTHTLEARPPGPQDPLNYPTFGYLDSSHFCSKMLFWTRHRPECISYAIGCITQHIAYPETACGDGCGFLL